MVLANEQNQLASEFVKLYFTSPRPVYELYDLEKDPSELNNLTGRKEMEEVEEGLKTALQRKMILDFDYLPLPIAPDAKGKAKAKTAPETKGKQADPARERQFLQKDTDKDGKLSWEEFSAGRGTDAEGWFKARDLNGDKFLSKEEFVTSSVANPPKK